MNDLPYEVYDANGVLVGTFELERFAQAFVSQLDWHESREPLRIVGPGERAADYNAEAMLGPEYDPDDVAFSGKFKAKLTALDDLRELTKDDDWSQVDTRGELVTEADKLPRLVEATPERPTLDQMEEGEPHRCADGAIQVIAAHKDGNAYEVLVSDEVSDNRMTILPSRLEVLDAPPPQRTVRDLRPGDVIHDSDAGWLICHAPEGGTFWQISRSQLWKLPTYQPIDKVYRFQV